MSTCVILVVQFIIQIHYQVSWITGKKNNVAIKNFVYILPLLCVAYTAKTADAFVVKADCI